MSWAGRRKAIIIAVASAIVLALLGALAYVIFYEPPTCIDQKQNQDELGIDCGGPCTTLCRQQVSSAPVVRFVRALTPQFGRTDVVAYIDNPNGNATANDAPFTLEVYDAQQRIIAKKAVTLDLPAASTVPVYLADVAPRGTVAAQAFLTFDDRQAVWQRAPSDRAVLPTVEVVAITEGTQPRITATLANPIAEPFYDVRLIATVFDAAGTAIAASQTLVPFLPAQGTAPLIFTWNEPFAAPAPRVEILPVQEVPALPAAGVL